MKKDPQLHPEETIIETLTLYAELRNAAETARQTGIIASTIRDWIQAHPDIVEKARSELRDAHMAKIVRLRGEVLDEMADKIRHPETTALELGKIYGILTDKQLILEGKPSFKAEITHHINEKQITEITIRTQERLQLLDKISGAFGGGDDKHVIPAKGEQETDS